MKQIVDVKEGLSVVHQIIEDINEEIGIAQKEIIQTENLLTTLISIVNSNSQSQLIHDESIHFLKVNLENLREGINKLEGKSKSYSLILNQLREFYKKQKENNMSEVQRKAREELRIT
ncbi:hypothetical protein MHH37_06695 [Solibacillus sp. FSL K6-1781]|uniref:hypothetical protein n=1 Tax=Solibacillus sp. FSL K6-1781 TaxID=2921474 RepID=UPI00315A0971